MSLEPTKVYIESMTTNQSVKQESNGENKRWAHSAHPLQLIIPFKATNSLVFLEFKQDWSKERIIFYFLKIQSGSSQDTANKLHPSSY